MSCPYPSASHGAGLMLDSPQRNTVSVDVPHYLVYEELVKRMIGGIVIVAPPVHAAVPPNYPVTLKIQAEGHGRLAYQWFTFRNDEIIEVPNGAEAKLVVIPQKSQRYVCRVSDHHFNYVFSDWIRVDVLDSPSSGLPINWDGSPHIVVHPKSQKVKPGKQVTLNCDAFGIPPPDYQWYRNGIIIKDKTTKALQIDCENAENAGSYLCCVTNVNGESWTEAADVEIVPLDQPRVSRPTATGKVALLIGNLNYSCHPPLMAPTMDVYELAQHLQQLDFRVVSLLDLSKKEMNAAIEKFLQLLDKGVYGLFYYAGHGYEQTGRNYMVPIDAPRPYNTGDCVCVQRIMKMMQERRTALNVILLDTCRKWYGMDKRQHLNVSEITPLAPLGNTVYGYATCEDAEAYEVQDARGKSTGIFTKYLNRHILQPEKVTHILEQVSEDLGRDPLVMGKQVCEIKHTLKEPRALTDPVRTAGHTCEVRVRDSFWRSANVLPKKELLAFPSGVKVELSFSALFSNVLVVFATVKDTGPKAQDCTVILTSAPGLEDIFSGPDRSEELDSLLMSQSDNADSTLRLCCLQRLQTSLEIKVDLHYMDIDSGRRLKESRSLPVGKPLVAACSLNSARPPGATGGQQGPQSYSSRPKQGEARLSARPQTRKAENAVDSRLWVPSTSGNQPEENDESDIHNFI
ncbi:mucosa-associated lymphoid tissue lymphoma translocation protein 1 isoform X2 [Alosa sapidissima]|uniref:mucosa-associated lymphoid tissue lymphoma translocation protein 1 isoform X2 n=1 Tax=Alosa sapidissima TaxID=34773 RepID=UPI001C09CAFF|nr:mucosa-associated lymphoid tissue lymphoma translocation protein 1 isoform X2 [Alosa sapidissima]